MHAPSHFIQGTWNDTACDDAKPYICKITKGKAEKSCWQASSLSYPLQTSVWIFSAEKPPATPAPGDGKCLPGWWSYGRHCYFAYNGKVGFSWPEARHFCQEVNGGELASIHSRAEVEFIRNINYTKYHYVWIGLTRDRSCTQQSRLSVCRRALAV